MHDTHTPEPPPAATPQPILPGRDPAAAPRSPLDQAMRDLFRRIAAASGASHPAGELAIESLSAPAFRALVAERLRSLERDVAEIRARINGLLFVVAGAVLSQLALRIFT